MSLPSLIVFGSQVDTPDPTYLSKIRTILLEDEQAADFVQDIIMLPSLWPSFEEVVPSLKDVPGHTLLHMLRCWIETGRTLEPTKPMPNTLLTPLTIIIHVAEYLYYLRHVVKNDHSKVLQDTKPNQFLGLCIGLLSSSAISSAQNETEIMAHAAAALRLAVIIGAIVDGDGYYATPRMMTGSLIVRFGEGSGRTTVDHILKGHSQVKLGLD